MSKNWNFQYLLTIFRYFQISSKIIGNRISEKHVCINRAWMDSPSWLIQALTHRGRESFSNTVFKIQAAEALPPEFHPALGADLLFVSSFSLFSNWVAKQQVLQHHWRNGAVAQSSWTERAWGSNHQKHQTKGWAGFLSILLVATRPEITHCKCSL